MHDLPDLFLPSHTESALSSRQPSQPSAVVGVPVLARALDGLELFFSAVTPHTGVSYLLVQQGEWAEWLAPQLRRIVPLPVHEPFSFSTGAGTSRHKQALCCQIEPDQLYLLPADGWYWDGIALQSTDGSDIAPDERDERGDLGKFFGGLAQAFGPRSVGLVLSGTDASLPARSTSAALGQGLAAVRAAGGRVLIQAPETAQYPQWPSEALGVSRAAGEGSAVLAASDLALYLGVALSQASTLTRIQAEWLGATYPPPALIHDLQEILRQLHAHTGLDLTPYHWTTTVRQIERRIQHLTPLLRVATLRDYGEWLEQHSSEADQFVHALAAGTTTFFRDPVAFVALENELRHSLSAMAAEGEGVPSEWRAWVVGCASGQEAYSAAMLMLELAEAQAAATGQKPVSVRVFASDIDPTLLAEAWRGWYSAATISVLSSTRRERFFEPQSGGYTVRPELRQCVTFTEHNALSDPPLSGIHLLTCRNLLVYLSPVWQQHLLKRFAYALTEGGLLMLSPSEGVTAAPFAWPAPEPEHTLPFDLLHGRWRIYRRAGGAFSLPLTMPPLQLASLQTNLRTDLQTELQPTLPLAPQADSTRSSDSSNAPTQASTLAASHALVDELTYELGYTRAYLQSVSEELARAKEEIRAARESLQAAGEQLHSMGQELRRLRESGEKPHEAGRTDEK